MSTFLKHDGTRIDELSPGPYVSHRSHGFAAEQPVARHPTIAALNPTKGKDVRPTPTHGGMTKQQNEGMNAGGKGHPTPGAAQPVSNPLAAVPPGKTFKPAAPVIGHRNRHYDSLHGRADDIASPQRAAEQHAFDHDLGRRILDEAYAAGSAHDRMARTQQVPLAPKMQPK